MSPFQCVTRNTGSPRVEYMVNMSSIAPSRNVQILLCTGDLETPTGRNGERTTRCFLQATRFPNRGGECSRVLILRSTRQLLHIADHWSCC